jgi:hypothetical protein
MAIKFGENRRYIPRIVISNHLPCSDFKIFLVPFSKKFGFFSFCETPGLFLPIFGNKLKVNITFYNTGGCIYHMEV